MEAHGVREHPARHAPRTVHPPSAAGGRHRRDPARVRRAAPRRRRSPAAADARHCRRARPCTCRRAPTTASSTRPSWTGCAPSGGRCSATRISTRWMSCTRSSSGSPTASSSARPAAASTARSSDRPSPPAGAETGDGDGSGGERRAGGSGERRRAGRGLARRSARAGDRERARGTARAARRRHRPRSRCSPTRRDPRRRRVRVGRGRGPGCRPGGCPTAASTGPPYPDEMQHARRYATRLRQALTHGTRQIDKRTPGGRFDGRAYARGRAQQAAGRPASTHPWRITRQVTRRSRSRTSGW